jgi:hypothetical protein
MACPTPTRAIRTSSLFIALFAVASCGRSVTTTTTAPPVQQDPRMAAVNVDVGPMFTHITRYRPGQPHSHLRPAREAGRQVTVQIAALGTSIDIDPARGPQGFRVIGTLENRDTRYTEAEFGLKPSTRYLIWVAPGPVNSKNNSRTRWGLLEYPRTRTGVFPSQPIGYVEECERHAQPAGRLSDVDFKPLSMCNANPGLQAPMPGPQPPWFPCPAGCCSMVVRSF